MGFQKCQKSVLLCSSRVEVKYLEPSNNSFLQGFPVSIPATAVVELRATPALALPSGATLDMAKIFRGQFSFDHPPCMCCLGDAGHSEFFKDMLRPTYLHS